MQNGLPETNHTKHHSRPVNRHFQAARATATAIRYSLLNVHLLRYQRNRLFIQIALILNLVLDSFIFILSATFLPFYIFLN